MSELLKGLLVVVGTMGITALLSWLVTVITVPTWKPPKDTEHKANAVIEQAMERIKRAHDAQGERSKSDG